MSVLSEVQPRIYALTGGLFANWMPPDQVDVGDYGIIAGDRFVREGNLRDWDIAYEVENTKKSRGKLDYSDRARVSVGADTTVTASVAGQKSPKASAQIKFLGHGAFLYHLSGITTRRLKNSRGFYRSLATKWIAGEISFPEKSVLVTEAKIADKATIVVSEGREGSLELHGGLSVSGHAILAEAKGGLSVVNSFGNMFKWLAADDTIPIIGLARPVIGSPGSGETAVSGTAGFLQGVRDLFRRRQWDIREISLDKYVERNGLATLTGVLPNNESLSIGLRPLTAIDFDVMNNYVDDNSGKVRENNERSEVQADFIKENPMASRSLSPFSRNMLAAPWNEESDHPSLVLRREMNRLFDDAFRGCGLSSFFGPVLSQVSAAPKIDVSETDNEIQVAAEMPGLDHEDVEVLLEDDRLILRGGKKSGEREDRDRNYHVRERVQGAFSRTLPLPFTPDPNQVRAELNNGVMIITIHTPQEVKQKRHRIEVEKGGSTASEPSVSRSGGVAGATSSQSPAEQRQKETAAE